MKQSPPDKKDSRSRRIAATVGTAVLVLLLLLLLLLLQRCSKPQAASSQPMADGDAGATTCDGLLEHDTWTGTIAFKHKRDVTDAKGEYHLRYEYEIDLNAEMTERTRRHRRGKDHLVQVFSPEPRGRVKAEHHTQHFDHRGLSASSKFSTTGGLQQFEKGMSEDGSMMSLTVKDDCTYQFYLQGQALGDWTVYDRHGGTKPSEGMLRIPGMHGDGIAETGSRLSGSADYPLMSSRHLEEMRSQGWINFVSEHDEVEEILGRDNLGTVTVTWNFEAKD